MFWFLRKKCYTLLFWHPSKLWLTQFIIAVWKSVFRRFKAANSYLTIKSGGDKMTTWHKNDSFSSYLWCRDLRHIVCSGITVFLMSCLLWLLILAWICLLLATPLRSWRSRSSCSNSSLKQTIFSRLSLFDTQNLPSTLGSNSPGSGLLLIRKSSSSDHCCCCWIPSI